MGPLFWPQLNLFDSIVTDEELVWLLEKALTL